jgi:hypothetical protein
VLAKASPKPELAGRACREPFATLRGESGSLRSPGGERGSLRFRGERFAALRGDGGLLFRGRAVLLGFGGVVRCGWRR